jgi:dTDP-4-dehydrorhamnose 3,5-epimerase-like enzyme
MLPTVGDLKLVTFPRYADGRGVLVSVDDLARAIPFPVIRIFWVSHVPAGAARGAHAHKACHQFLVCAAGSLLIEAYDGSSERTLRLVEGQGVHVPPGIFATQRYEDENTTLIVFCDRPYERGDYLADHGALISFRMARPCRRQACAADDHEPTLTRDSNG